MSLISKGSNVIRFLSPVATTPYAELNRGIHGEVCEIPTQHGGGMKEVPTPAFAFNKSEFARI